MLNSHDPYIVYHNGTFFHWGIVQPNCENRVHDNNFAFSRPPALSPVWDGVYEYGFERSAHSPHL